MKEIDDNSREILDRLNKDIKAKDTRISELEAALENILSETVSFSKFEKWLIKRIELICKTALNKKP